MVRLQSNHLPVDEECRNHPRIGFHLPVSIMGINVQASILDFSLSGLRVRVDCTDYISEGQSLRVALRFPGENSISMIKVKVVRVEKQIIGGEFIDLGPDMQELIERNFEIFRHTLPIQ